jgi:hypothetical protein
VPNQDLFERFGVHFVCRRFRRPSATTASKMIAP